MPLRGQLRTDRLEVERIVDAGREAAISTILEMAEAIRGFTERVAELERKKSENGEQFTARILTVARTCHKQGRNAYHFLTDLMDAAFKGTPRPALV